MPKIQFLPDNIIFDIDEEKTLLENALSQGIPQARPVEVMVNVLLAEFG